MAQDFGDDMGNALLNFVTRQAENYLRFGRGRERAFDWWQRHYKKEGNTPEAAKAMAEKQSSREQVVVPFGTSEEAAYYAQVCRENGTYAAAYTDKQGNGFLAFAKEDAKTVAGYAPQFRDVMARLDEQRITDALNHAEPVDKKTMDSLTELTGYPDLPAEDVTVIPVTIRYKDAPEETYDVLFSEQDTENLNIDDSICFSGYSHKELTEMVGRETHEDFDVIAVSDPYAARIPTMPPRKPRKKKPAFCPLVSARSIVISIWSFPASLEYICPIPSFFFAKPGHGAFAPVPAPRPAGILPSSARYGTICSGMPSSRKEEPWLPFKISRSVSRNRRRNSPNSKRRKRNLKRRFASGTGSGALWSPIPLVKVCSPPSVALGRNSTSTHSTDSLRAMQTR